MQEELRQQVLEQKESLTEIAEMLAVEPSEQLQQVLQLCSLNTPALVAVQPHGVVWPWMCHMILFAAV